MQIITMYLPQFHRVKENDEWWGEGYTEWTAVKKAEKLYENHYQPRVPLDQNYYNLLDKCTMIWQSQLMKKYGVDGQCFYHYWFKDGQRILEQPAENLLHWSDVDMPFCFCWANVSWARTWSKLNNKTVWSNLYEKKDLQNDNGILLEQQYGDEQQWKEHYEYLSLFFRDSRYMKLGNKPIFLIYCPNQIYCLHQMLLKWRKWAEDEGFDGLYVIGINNEMTKEGGLDAILYQQPGYFRSKYIDKNNYNDTGTLKLDYDDVWQKTLMQESFCQDVFYGGVVGFDDTPRQGGAGCVIENASPQKFQRYLSELIAKNVSNDKSLIFINAWNEWGEGMYLEPDEKYQYGYLESVLYAREHYKEYLDKYKGNLKKGGNREYEEEIQTLRRKNLRYESYWRILNQWLILKENNISLEQYFIKRKMHSIAIYGMGVLGKHLLFELRSTAISVDYVIDRKQTGIHVGLRVYSPDENLPEVDAIIVTVTYDFADIYNQLSMRGSNRIISLEEVLEGVQYK